MVDVGELRQYFVVVSPIRRSDLVLETLEIKPTTLAAGEQVVATVNIRNRATSTATGVVTVLVNGEVVWEHDIADDSKRGAPTDFTVDVSDRVKPGETFTLAIRNFDKVGMDVRLETDCYVQGLFSRYRPGDVDTLSTTCWWGDVTLWEGALAEAPKWRRPTSKTVEEWHKTHWPFPPAGQEAKLPVDLKLEGAGGALVENTALTCGVPVGQGGVARSGK